MRVSDLLISIASWLENPDNEAVLLSEYHDECLQKTSEGCVKAAEILRKTAEEVDQIEPQEDSLLTPENLEGLSDIALAFDLSDNPELVKQAQILDELLMSIAAPKDAVRKIKEAKEKIVDEFTRKYKNTKENLDANGKIKEATKEIQDLNVYKKYEMMEQPLSARTCPDHAGALLIHSADGVWQCSLDKKQYDFTNGFKKQDGSQVPGGQVEGSHPEQSDASIFDTRNDRLGI